MQQDECDRKRKQLGSVFLIQAKKKKSKKKKKKAKPLPFCCVGFVSEQFSFLFFFFSETAGRQAWFIVN